MLHEILNLN